MSSGKNCVGPISKTNITDYNTLLYILFPLDEKQSGGGLKEVQMIICFMVAVLCGIYPNPASNKLGEALIILRDTHFSPQCVPNETQNIISILVKWVGMDPFAKCIKDQEQFNLDNQVYFDILKYVLIMCISASLIGLASKLISIVNGVIGPKKKTIATSLEPLPATGETSIVTVTDDNRLTMEQQINRFVLTQDRAVIAELANHMVNDLMKYQSMFGPLPIDAQETGSDPQKQLLIKGKPGSSSKKTKSATHPSKGGSNHKKNKRIHRRYTKKCK